MGAGEVVGLSDWATVTISSDGRLYRQEYERGLPITDIDNIGPSTTPWGTTITFHPDPDLDEGVQVLVGLVVIDPAAQHGAAGQSRQPHIDAVRAAIW